MKVLADRMHIIGDPNIEIATRERLLERGFQTRFAATAAEVGNRHSISVSLAMPLQIGTYHLGGMGECRCFDVEGPQQSMEKFEQPREDFRDDTSAAGPRPERPPLRSPSPDVQLFAGAEEKKCQAQPQLASSMPFSDGSRHSRRLGMFHEADLKCHLDEWGRQHRVWLQQ